jgi:large subunit ribosomal protein L25
MKTIEISAKLREGTGKADTKKLRKEGMVPCELYGANQENVHFYAHHNAFKNMVYTPLVFIVKLDIDGSKYDAIMKDIQFHPVTDAIIHIDFLRVEEGRELKVDVPVNAVGTPVGVTEGGLLFKRARTLKVLGLPKHLPDQLDVNVTELGIGDSVNVRDLDYENLILLDAPNSVVCAVRTTRMQMTVEEEELEAEEAAAAEAAEAAEGEEGEAPAEGDEKKSEE